MPKDLSVRVALTRNAGGEADEQQAPLAPWEPAEVAEQARHSGYGNRFEPSAS